MKATPSQIKNILTAFFILISTISHAQGIHRYFKFKKGDEFERQIIVRSNCVLQRASQSLRISSYSSLTRSYKVTDASDKGASFNIITSKIIDTVDALGRKMIFDSEKRPDPNSDIQMGLLQMIGKTAGVTVDNKGQIISIQKPMVKNDTLMSFTGIQPENIAAGQTLGFIVDFPYNPSIKKGFAWADASPISETNYTIYAVTGRTTTITYTSSIFASTLNSRINGVMLIDNETGIILKRSSQSVSTGYEVVNGVVYTATRRTAIAEVSYRK
jgi:hypothetical protein